MAAVNLQLADTAHNLEVQKAQHEAMTGGMAGQGRGGGGQGSWERRGNRKGRGGRGGCGDHCFAGKMRCIVWKCSWASMRPC